MHLDVSFGWKDRAAIARRQRGKRWQRFGLAALVAVGAAILWFGAHWQG